ncbi:MAG TPA: hypothetical protein PKA58_12275 [Polyangium sp.]|jgi:hypothetical protein|nr:hypothetical protein [Polyangium sp.]
MSLSDPIVLVRVEKYHKLLTVFAWGAKVTFRAGDVSFTANCSNPIGGLNLLAPEAEERAAAYFTPGRELLLELSLFDAASGHVATVLEQPVESQIREIDELDWEVHGVTTSEVDEEQVLIDCGVPMLAFWNGDPVPAGTYARWTGEIRAYVVKNPEVETSK